MQLSKDVSGVVTGGASGLGAATAKALAAKGARIAILDLNADAGERLAKEIGGVFAKCDVTSEQSVDAALAAARKAHGQERILVNCAGIGVAKRISRRVKETNSIEPHDLATFTKVIQVNLIGTFLMMAKSAIGMQATKPLNDEGERGVMICTSSVAAQDGQIGQVAYSASKGGVASMTLPVARDLSRDGIRVVTIMPGLFLTPMFDSLPEEARKSLAASVPFPSRLGHPTEYAALAVHICENIMINGECIRLDGAVRLAPR
jgi:NAD(P)-dependent dehydrogenase (short-subunit alcohol dehydrogenase family)